MILKISYNKNSTIYTVSKTVSKNHPNPITLTANGVLVIVSQP